MSAGKGFAAGVGSVFGMGCGCLLMIGLAIVGCGLLLSTSQSPPPTHPISPPMPAAPVPTSGDRASEPPKKPHPEPFPSKKEDGDRPTDLAISDAEALYQAYESNEVRSDQRYKNKLMAVRGRIDKVGKDLLDTPYVSLAGPQTSIFGVQCMFSRDDESALGNLSPGHRITIAGTCSGKMGNVILTKCWIYSEADAVAKRQAAAEQARQEALEKAKAERIAETERRKAKAQEMLPERAASALNSARRMEGEARKKWLKKVISDFPGTPAADEAQELLDQESR